MLNVITGNTKKIMFKVGIKRFRENCLAHCTTLYSHLQMSTRCQKLDYIVLGACRLISAYIYTFSFTAIILSI